MKKIAVSLLSVLFSIVFLIGIGFAGEIALSPFDPSDDRGPSSKSLLEKFQTRNFTTPNDFDLLEGVFPCHVRFLERKIIPLDGQANDHFGYAVSISRDHVIVGAPQDNDQGAMSGSAYIFERNGNTWSQAIKLLADDPSANAFDQFGHSVAITGNFAIVGAHYDDDAGISSGSAYVFERGVQGWVQVAKLTANDGAAHDFFGHAVAISGNYAVVSAPGDDDNGEDSGSAYIFKRNPTGWEQTAKLVADDGEAEDSFGGSISIANNIVVIGASKDNDKGSESGSAYVFFLYTDGWGQVAKLTAEDGAAHDHFGHAVSISGCQIVISAHRDDDNGLDSGSAYIFRLNPDGWEESAKLIASDGEAEDYFGYSVGISGDRVIVGASLDDDDGLNAGAAYIFERNGSNWVETRKLTAHDGEADDLFGYALGISYNHMVVGAFRDDDWGERSGGAYLYIDLKNIRFPSAPPASNG